MRLINARTRELKEFVADFPPYAILSHTWGEEEVTLRDAQSLETASKMKGYAKIAGCAAQALADGYKWIWVDTCCIDKTSSAELSEAINSMYQWYARAGVCYVYLADVSPMSDEEQWELYKCQDPRDRSVLGAQFSSSRWLKRGWTLQELIAPADVQFFSGEWTHIGSKLSLSALLEDCTGIPEPVLRGISAPQMCSIAERMSWAAGRVTTRAEDMAYCLLGLFRVNMPLLYGEGEARAFIRLQEEVLKRSEDFSLLAWASEWWRHNEGILDLPLGMDPESILATTPKSFAKPTVARVFEFSPIERKHKGNRIHLESAPAFVLKSVHYGEDEPWYFEPPVMTSRGMLVTLPVFRNEDECQTSWRLAWTHTRLAVPAFGSSLARSFLACIMLAGSTSTFPRPGDPLSYNGSKPPVVSRVSGNLYLVDEQYLSYFRPLKMYLSGQQEDAPRIIGRPRVLEMMEKPYFRCFDFGFVENGEKTAGRHDTGFIRINLPADGSLAKRGHNGPYSFAMKLLIPRDFPELRDDYVANLAYRIRISFLSRPKLEDGYSLLGTGYCLPMGCQKTGGVYVVLVAVAFSVTRKRLGFALKLIDEDVGTQGEAMEGIRGPVPSPSSSPNNMCSGGYLGTTPKDACDTAWTTPGDKHFLQLPCGHLLVAHFKSTASCARARLEMSII